MPRSGGQGPPARGSVVVTAYYALAFIDSDYLQFDKVFPETSRNFRSKFRITHRNWLAKSGRTFLPTTFDDVELLRFSHLLRSTRITRGRTRRTVDVYLNIGEPGFPRNWARMARRLTS